MRPEVVRDISKSVLSKSRLHKNNLGQKCLQSLRVKRFRLLKIIAERVIRKRNIEKKVRSFALREDDAIWKAIDCHQGEGKCSYRGFVTVVISIIIIALHLVLFGRVSRCFYTCFCIVCYCFS